MFPLRKNKKVNIMCTESVNKQTIFNVDMLWSVCGKIKYLDVG